MNTYSVNSIYFYRINSIFFSRGLINVPKYSIVKDGVEYVEPLLDMNTIAGDPRYRIAMSVSVELMRFGKILSPVAFYGFSQLTIPEQITLAGHLKDYLKELYFDNGEYHTLFGDFPNTVLGMSEGEMLVHQIAHYWASAIGCEYWPNLTEGNDSESMKASLSSTISACCKDKYDVIEAASADDLADSIKVLVSSQQSLTKRDQEVVYGFFANLDTLTVSPLKKLEMKSIDIPFKETLCLVSTACPDAQVCKDINDVLRVAMYMSGADISLAPIPKIKDYGWKKAKMTKNDRKPWNFKNFTSAQTRQLLSNIDRIVSEKKDRALEDMKRYLGRWIRLGEKLHPGSSKNTAKYPNAAIAFQVLRNSPESIKTFGTSVELAKSDKDLDKILSLYSKRPGELARQIDWIIRTFIEGQESPKAKDKKEEKATQYSSSVFSDALKKANVNIPEIKDITLTEKEKAENARKIFKAFNDVVKNISTKMLYELIEHFHERKQPMSMRQVYIKGARKPVDLPLLDPISKDIAECAEGVILKEIVARMSQKEDLSETVVFIDKRLEDLELPKNMRSTGDSVLQMTRGSKISLPGTSSLMRFFLFWTDEHGNEDLDLNVKFYGEDFSLKDTISWNSDSILEDQSGNRYAQFSGDVRHHRGNCAEYVDVDIPKAIANGNRYLVATAYDFNSNSFNNAFGGLMARKEWGTVGETTWAPATVETGFKIFSRTQSVILCIIDLVSRKMIVVNEDQDGFPADSRLDYRKFDNLYTLLDKYINHKSFFNGLTLVSTYYKACGAKVYVESSSTIEDIKMLKAAADAGEDMHEDNLKVLRETYGIKQGQDVKFVTFDDLARDYSKLLEYMF